MLKVKLKNGHIYNNVHDITVWSLDDRFLYFTWGKNKEGILILPKDEILSIGTDL